MFGFRDSVPRRVVHFRWSVLFGTIARQNRRKSDCKNGLRDIFWAKSFRGLNWFRATCCRCVTS